MTGAGEGRPAGPLGFRLPFNRETGELIESRWRRGLRHDSIHLVDRHARNLRSLQGICIDSGWRDQRHIRYGAWILSQRLAAARIHHVYGEFGDDHSDIDYRMDVSLLFLTRVLTAWRSPCPLCASRLTATAPSRRCPE